MGELISIVIPTKNNGDVLERCLSSIEGLDCHAGVAETRGRRSGGRGGIGLSRYWTVVA